MSKNKLLWLQQNVMKISIIFVILAANFFFHATSYHLHKFGLDHRETLEIIIGGGGGGGEGDPDSPPPPPDDDPYCLPPLSSSPLNFFHNRRLELVYPVIQKFKQKIKSNPLGNTSTWVGPDICNTYKGFFCDVLLENNETVLAGVKFNGFNLDGPHLTLDGFIDKLPDLIVFHANSNNFKGSFPLKLSKLKYLYELDLSNNRYTGEFPYQLLQSTKISFLDLRFNSFSGRVPPQVFSMHLEVLFINNNHFSQPIPDLFGSTPAIFVSLANNNLTGTIPKSIGQASITLLEILLLNNELSGCLPREIGLLSKLTVFDASGNFLTGPIPNSFACLTQMKILNLARNRLQGSVPEVVCKLPNLSNLSLPYNYFTEVGAECLKLIKENVLDVGMNCIGGLSGQRPAEECRDFLSKNAQFCGDERSLIWMPCNGIGHRSFFKSSRNAMSRSEGLL